MSNFAETRNMSIKNMRMSGFSYSKIAEVLNLSVNTVKSICRRENIGIEESTSSDLEIKKDHDQCPQCHHPIDQNPKRKHKRFCSDVCRMAWWKANRSTVKQSAWYETKCGFCRKTFHSYGNRHRKYCSHSCYIHARFGGARS